MAGSRSCSSYLPPYVVALLPWFGDDDSRGMGGGPPRMVYCCPPLDSDKTRENRNKPFQYPDNYISTTNYTLWTFIPLDLISQFYKISNIYFLLNMVIAFIPNVSPVFPVTTIVPLVIVVGVAMARDAADDIMRYRADRRANGRYVQRVDPSATGVIDAKAKSQDLRVGDIILIANHEEVPADCATLCSSANEGGCFVETSNLDGETNLKAKMTKSWIQHYCCGKAARDVEARLERVAARAVTLLLAEATIECDAPSITFNKWQGKLTVHNADVYMHEEETAKVSNRRDDATKVVEALDLDYFLLRGCTLRNVDWVLACVVYTGVHTKMFLNLTKAPPKVGRIDKKLNTLVLTILIVQQVIIAFLSMGTVLFRDSHAGGGWYFQTFMQEYNHGAMWIMSYFTYFILLAVMMPISLFVSLEFCKAIQARFMEWDNEMSRLRPIERVGDVALAAEVPPPVAKRKKKAGGGKDDDDDVVSSKEIQPMMERVRMRARSSTLNEELSQVQCVFSDKTGTLTENEMRFAKAFAGGWCFDILHEPSSVLHFLQRRRHNTPKVPSPLLLRNNSATMTMFSDASFDILSDANTRDRLRGSSYIFDLNVNKNSGSPENSPDSFNNNNRNGAMRGDAPPAFNDDENAYVWNGSGNMCAAVGNESDKQAVYNFLRALAYCNTVVINVTREEGTTLHAAQRPKIEYFGSSTDEVALVNMAANNGARLASRTSDTMTVDFSDISYGMPADSRLSPHRRANHLNGNGNASRMTVGDSDAQDVDTMLMSRAPSGVLGNSRIETVDLLAVLPFTSERKMMSVVLRESDGAIHMYTKGADSNVMARLLPDEDDVAVVNGRARCKSDSMKRDSSPSRMRDGGGQGLGGAMTIARAQQFLDNCSKEGLRTLVCAERYISEDTFQRWNARWKDAMLDTSSKRDEIIHNMALEAETDLTLIGCTAIEDRLQELVPETVDFLLKCGIMVWVLTGDKRETAYNIAITSKLLNPSNDFIAHVDFGERGVESPEEVLTSLRSTMDEIRMWKEQERKTSIIIDGKSLELVLDDEEIYEAFRKLAMMLDSAVCCRVTPLQKARVVLLFQRQGLTCLAIGDGANDVSMIQAARVGIGIMGLEGSQAERAADYAIPRFHHLRRLLVVHGRYSLFRNSQLIQYSFYKNLVYALTQCYFSFYNGFSGTTLFDSWVIMFYNMAFTLFPPLVMGVFDYDVRASALMETPSLYPELRSPVAVRMSRKSSLVWFLGAVFHSWVIFFAVLVTTLWDDTLADNGQSGGMWSSGTVMMTVMLFVVTVQAVCTFATWTWIHFAAVILSIALYIAFLFIYSSIPIKLGVSAFHGVPARIFKDSTLWLNLIVWTFAMVIVIVLLMYTRSMFITTQTHIARIADHKNKKAKRIAVMEQRQALVAQAHGVNISTMSLDAPLLPMTVEMQLMQSVEGDGSASEGEGEGVGGGAESGNVRNSYSPKRTHDLEKKKQPPPPPPRMREVKHSPPIRGAQQPRKAVGDKEESPDSPLILAEESATAYRGRNASTYSFINDAPIQESPPPEDRELHSKDHKHRSKYPY